MIALPIRPAHELVRLNNRLVVCAEATLHRLLDLRSSGSLALSRSDGILQAF